MANVTLTAKKLEFIIEDELLHCNIFYESSEPGTLHLSGGWKTKTFPKSVSVADIITDPEDKYGFGNFIMWADGRTGN